MPNHDGSQRPTLASVIRKAKAGDDDSYRYGYSLLEHLECYLLLHAAGGQVRPIPPALAEYFAEILGAISGNDSAEGHILPVYLTPAHLQEILETKRPSPGSLDFVGLLNLRVPSNRPPAEDFVKDAGLFLLAYRLYEEMRGSGPCKEKGSRGNVQVQETP